MKISWSIPAVLAFLLTIATPVVWSQADLFEECDTNEDCLSEACVTGFQVPGSPGMCVCNEETNFGCNDTDQEVVCVYPPGLDDGFPQCLPAIGEPCQFDFECATGRCFYGEQQDESLGTCRCNSEFNDGCSDGYFCSDAELPAGGFPKCVLPVGANCTDNSDCETLVCFSNMFVPQAKCVCDVQTNLGCPDDEVCAKHGALADIPPSCVTECSSDDECDTNVCFDGRCQCNVANNLGCDDGQICFGDDIGGYNCAVENGPTPSPTMTPVDETNPPTTPAPTTTSTSGTQAPSKENPDPTNGATPAPTGSPPASTAVPTTQQSPGSSAPSSSPTNTSSAFTKSVPQAVVILIPIALFVLAS